MGLQKPAGAQAAAVAVPEPGKPYLGAGVDRPLPRYFDQTGNASLTRIQGVRQPVSSAQVLQCPPRNQRVSGSSEQGSSGPPSTLTGRPEAAPCPRPAHNPEWVPSQSGGLPLCLQPQKNTFPAASAVYFTGARPVPLCEPSQKGCFFECPQAHQK